MIKKLIISSLVVIISVIVGSISFGLPQLATKPEILGDATRQIGGISSQLAVVNRVIDGDTIEVIQDQQKYTVRLVGMNTPETVDPRRPVECFGHEASDETKKLLTGKQVYLAKDVSETDKFNRLLRLVYLPIDHEQILFVNEYLVRQGYAQVLTYPPDVRFEPVFIQAQQYAQQHQLGLWSKCHST